MANQSPEQLIDVLNSYCSHDITTDQLSLFNALSQQNSKGRSAFDYWIKGIVYLGGSKHGQSNFNLLKQIQIADILKSYGIFRQMIPVDLQVFLAPIYQDALPLNIKRLINDDDCICPISFSIYRSPITLTSHHSHSVDSPILYRWILDHPTHPFTNQTDPDSYDFSLESVLKSENFFKLLEIKYNSLIREVERLLECNDFSGAWHILSEVSLAKYDSKDKVIDFNWSLYPRLVRYEFYLNFLFKLKLKMVARFGSEGMMKTIFAEFSLFKFSNLREDDYIPKDLCHFPIICDSFLKDKLTDATLNNLLDQKFKYRGLSLMELALEFGKFELFIKILAFELPNYKVQFDQIDDIRTDSDHSITNCLVNYMHIFLDSKNVEQLLFFLNDHSVNYFSFFQNFLHTNTPHYKFFLRHSESFLFRSESFLAHSKLEHENRFVSDYLIQYLGFKYFEYLMYSISFSFFLFGVYQVNNVICLSLESIELRNQYLDTFCNS